VLKYPLYFIFTSAARAEQITFLVQEKPEGVWMKIFCTMVSRPLQAFF
jgi:hypothetical protein